MKAAKQDSKHLIERIRKDGHKIGFLGMSLFKKTYRAFHYKIENRSFTIEELEILANKLNCRIEDLYKPISNSPEGDGV